MFLKFIKASNHFPTKYEYLLNYFSYLHKFGALIQQSDLKHEKL